MLSLLTDHGDGENHAETGTHRDADNHALQRDTDRNADTDTDTDGDTAVVQALVFHTLSHSVYSYLTPASLPKYCM